MVDVIICTVNTGRVVTKSFGTLTEAEAHVEKFFSLDKKRPRSRRDYRVELKRRTPEPTPVVPVPVLAPAA